MSNAEEAKFHGVFGATGTGKSLYVRSLLKKKRKRILVWSPKERKDNYAGMLGAVPVTSWRELSPILGKAGHAGPFCVVFVPSLDRKRDEAQFDVVCRALLELENCTLVPEELHTVTQATWAPQGWKNVALMGRASGLEVIGTSQRPAQVDKSFFSSLSVCHTGRLIFKEDAKTIAASVLVPPEELMALPNLHYVQRVMDGGAPTRGVISGALNRGKK